MDTTMIEMTEEELVAVITAAIAASIDRPASSLVVRKIVRTGNLTSEWTKIARLEQLDSRRY